MTWVIRRTDQGGGWLRRGGRVGQGWTHRLQHAQTFPTREAAERELCPENERVELALVAGLDIRPEHSKRGGDSPRCERCGGPNDWGRLCGGCVEAERAARLALPPDPRRCRYCGAFKSAPGHSEYLCGKRRP